MEYFTPKWRRPRRKNDVVIPTNPHDTSAEKPHLSSSLADPLFWYRYPCLVCGKPPPNPTQKLQRSSVSSSHHKRCSRCRSAIYCSSECQKKDYIEGKHKKNCIAIGELWEEKDRLESCMWENKSKSTNPFDDEVYDYPIVGKFWHDQPQSGLQKNTTKYCVALLQLVQLLGRAESWRVSHFQQSKNNSDSHDEGNSRRRGPGNPLSRELAIDLAYQLLSIDRTDIRVRLVIPSLLLEGEYYQEAYDFLKHWLKADTSLTFMDLALMCGEGEEEIPEVDTTGFPRGEDIVESPEKWMDGEMVYPSIGMVFELAFLKCHMLCSLKSGQFQTEGSCDGEFASFGMEEKAGTEPISIGDRCTTLGKDDLELQVRQLLSVVHKWNPHLLPNLGEPYDIETGAFSNNESVMAPSSPPALSSLLNKHPPGFELQYKMGNPGGQTMDEAVSIWQRDMILWHVVDPMAMKFLADFCSNIEENLVDTSCLNGGVKTRVDSSLSNGLGKVDKQNISENVLKRKEAEELVARLQRENPDRTMGDIMMHPEMAQLMIKHLHTE